MAVDNYKGLRQMLIALLKDLEKVKKKTKKAIRFSSKIGGPLKKETPKVMKQFDAIAKNILRLEQETREI